MVLETEQAYFERHRDEWLRHHLINEGGHGVPLIVHRDQNAELLVAAGQRSAVAVHVARRLSSRKTLSDLFDKAGRFQHVCPTLSREPRQISSNTPVAPSTAHLIVIIRKYRKTGRSRHEADSVRMPAGLQGAGRARPDRRREMKRPCLQLVPRTGHEPAPHRPGEASLNINRPVSHHRQRAKAIPTAPSNA